MDSVHSWGFGSNAGNHGRIAVTITSFLQQASRRCGGQIEIPDSLGGTNKCYVLSEIGVFLASTCNSFYKIDIQKGMYHPLMKRFEV